LLIAGEGNGYENINISGNNIGNLHKNEIIIDTSLDELDKFEDDGKDTDLELPGKDFELD